MAEALLPAAQFTTFQSALDRYAKYIASATACRGSVENLLHSKKPVPKALSGPLTDFLNGLKTLLSSQDGPDLTDETLIRKTDAVTAVAAQCLKNLNDGRALDEQALQDALVAATVPWSGTPGSALRTALKQAAYSIRPLYQSISDIVGSLCQVRGGECPRHTRPYLLTPLALLTANQALAVSGELDTDPSPAAELEVRMAPLASSPSRSLRSTVVRMISIS